MNRKPLSPRLASGRTFPIGLLLIALTAAASAAEPEPPRLQRPETFDGLELRSIGPALMSGRIADVAVDPTDRATWYVAAASGGVWKTVNAGTTWEPIFDDQGSYSIGCVTLDPKNPRVVWVGTGENNSQRSVGYGDGVYKSLDGGQTWRNVGLERSEHVGKIVVDPRDSDVVYVAAQGPLWAPGGDRGLYKTTDGGESWRPILEISENTGVTDVVLDPREPDVLLAASFQRRRRVWTLIAGGPESAIHKSTDGGETWRRLDEGLPEGDLGRIGLALSPQNPDVVYATVAAARDHSGFYRSDDRGESWQRMSDYVAIDPQYYQEIYPDPHRFDRVYLADVWLHVSDDGGRTFTAVSSEHKHVDNHAVVFDPRDPDYLLVGCDGGLYESFDRAATWRFVANLPITQFYRVDVDTSEPFYRVYGGTQDNDTQGGPSRTNNVHGIRNSDWLITVGGDGYQTRVDPTNPDVVYSMWQYGGLVRFDRRSGELVDIQPQPERGEPALKWNWDSPLVLSPHDPERLYFGANRLFRSDDRGNSWRPISGDLTRGIDRNRLEVMGKVWSVDAVWKNVFTSFYGNLVSLDESPLVEGLIYAGSDDGLVHVTEDGGGSWRTVESFPGVPERTYVADLLASRQDPDKVFALFNNHKSGDFQPYALESTDRGRSWSSIASNLPERHVTWSIAEDHGDPDLLFLGTEFGLFVTFDGGGRWTRLRGGLPTVAFRDLAIQRRENDLVAGTFGRGIYILDDYTPLRGLSEEVLQRESELFEVKNAWLYVEDQPLGDFDKASQGHAFFTAPNPPFGAIFTYYLRDAYRSLSRQREEREKPLDAAMEPVPVPSWEELRREDREEVPAVVLTVRDAEDQVVHRIEGPTEAGFHRVAWDLRYPPVIPHGIRLPEDPWYRPPQGPLVAPGRYSVELAKRVGGTLETLGERRSFEVEPLGLETLPAADREALVAFQRRVAEMLRVVMAADQILSRTSDQLAAMKRALDDTPGEVGELARRARGLEAELADLRQVLTGDETVRRRNEPVPPAILQRVERAAGAFSSTSAPTATHRRNLEIAGEGFAELEERLRSLEGDLAALGEAMEAAGSPWTPGRPLPQPRR